MTPAAEEELFVCRRKPGPRCPSCQRRALASIQGRLERVAAELAEAPDGKRAALQAEARDLARQVACRRADLYATPAFQRETLAEIEHRIEQNPKDQTIGRLAAQVVEGRIMDRYRREQQTLMPPMPVNVDAQIYHQQLGDARFDMAHARLRMDMSQGSQSEWQEWQKRHHQAAQRAALAQTRMEAVENGGASGWTSLTHEEQRARRDATATDPSLATPVAPRLWSDVVDETQDLIDGIRPVRDSVDDAGYRPYGDTNPHHLSVDEPTSTTGDADGTDEAASVSPESSGRSRRYVRGDEQSLTKQSRRRARRRSGARGTWRSLMADRRKVAATTRRIDSTLDEIGPNTQIDGSVFDLTFLSFLTEQLGGQR